MLSNPPTVRSRVLTNRALTRDSPAGNARIIWPVSAALSGTTASRSPRRAKPDNSAGAAPTRTGAERVTRSSLSSSPSTARPKSSRLRHCAPASIRSGRISDLRRLRRQDCSDRRQPGSYSSTPSNPVVLPRSPACSVATSSVSHHVARTKNVAAADKHRRAQPQSRSTESAPSQPPPQENTQTPHRESTSIAREIAQTATSATRSKRSPKAAASRPSPPPPPTASPPHLSVSRARQSRRPILSTRFRAASLSL